MKDNHLNTAVMFDSNLSGNMYKAIMNEKRFQFLISSLRFDDYSTRTERKKADAFAPIRKIWDNLVENCKQNYKPSSYLTIDEQLLGFRGRCPFRMYMPAKPARYGIKIVMLCDVSTKYMVDAIPYLGKSTKTDGKPLATHFVQELTKSIHGSNRNITMDNWFTSIPLAETLLCDPYKLTVIGTVRKNKPQIPPEMLNVSKRKPGTSMFCFDNNITLVSYVPKKNKNVILLSTMHDQPTISSKSKKPAIIDVYNSTKGAVDAFDQMSTNMSCNRKTRRWPLCIFYNMLNIIGINSCIIFNHKRLTKKLKPIARKEFLYNLSVQLTRPWIEHRSNYKTLSRPLQEIIRGTLNPRKENNEATHHEGKRTICGICPAKKRRMTTTYCHVCQRPICGEHRATRCTEC